MVRRAATLALLALASVTVAACGGGQGSSARTSATGTAASGKEVFAVHCSVCHSLTGRNNPRLQGGDLLGFHAGRRQVVQFVREMPRVHGPLSNAELQAVVDYVTAAERRGAVR
jgi:mono/diheme cytochrome c family protein